MKLPFLRIAQVSCIATLFGICIIFPNKSKAQSLAVNTTGATADASSIIDISSSNKGMLIPRVALTGTGDVTTIASPATSLLIYNTATVSNVTPGYYYWTGSAWTKVLTTGTAWLLTGNAGTTYSANFLGTTDTVPLRFRVNNQKSGMIDMLGTAFLGYHAGNSNTANNNTAMGFEAMYSNTSGSENTAMGADAMASNTTSVSNSAFGTYAMTYSGTGSFNTALGANALMHNAGYANIAVGAEAMINNGTGTDNVSVGYRSLWFNDNGDKNVAVGREALYNNHTGFENTALGHQALYSNFSGTKNIAIGSKALYTNSGTSNNVAIGSSALYGTYGDNNIGIGQEALAGPNGGVHNTGIGYQTLLANSSGNWNFAAGNTAMYMNTSGSYNNAIGYQALATNVTGSSNVAIGYKAMYTAGTSDGSDNVAIGSRAGAFNVTGSNNTLIGTEADVQAIVSNSTAIGYQAKVSTYNSLVLGAPGTNVGIGLPNPANLLHVYGFGNQQVTIENPFPGNTTGLILKSGGLDVGRFDHTGSYLRIEDYSVSSGWRGISINQGKVGINTSGPTADLSVNGTADNATGTWGVYSDDRIKTIEHPFTDGLNVIRQINPVVFRYNAKAPYPVADAQIGIVAQELEKIAPYMVSQKPFNNFSDLREVNNQAYVFLLINAVKEQQERIERLERIVKELKEK